MYIDINGLFLALGLAFIGYWIMFALFEGLLFVVGCVDAACERLVRLIKRLA